MIRHTADFSNMALHDMWVECADTSTSFDPMTVVEHGARNCLSGQEGNWLYRNVLQYGSDSSVMTDLGDGWAHLRINSKFVAVNNYVEVFMYTESDLVGKVQIYADSAIASRYHIRWYIYAAFWGGSSSVFNQVFNVTMDGNFHTVALRWSKAKLCAKVDNEEEQIQEIPAADRVPYIRWYKVNLTGQAYYSFYEFFLVYQDVYGVDAYNRLLADGEAEPNVTVKLWSIATKPPDYTWTSDADGDISFAAIPNGDYYIAAVSDANYCWFQQIRVVSGEVQ